MNNPTPLSRQLRFWMIGASIASLGHEMIQAQMISILWGSLIGRYTLTLGIFILALGLGALFCPAVTNTKKVFIYQQLIVGLMGLGVPWIILWSATHLTITLSTFIAAILIFVLGFISGFEFPLLNSMALDGDSSKQKSSHVFSQLMQADYASMGIAILTLPLFAFRHNSLFAVSAGISGLNFLVALSCCAQPHTAWKNKDLPGLLTSLIVCGSILVFYFWQRESLLEIAQSWIGI